MTWRLRSGPGSYRGVPFQLEADELVGGKKTVVHEYPLRDQPFVEELGLRGPSLSVEAYVVGDDYLRQRDALIAALQMPGPGTLLLPYLNLQTRKFTVPTWRVANSREEGGIARFLIEFLETPAAPVFPTQMADLMAGVDLKVKGVLDAAQLRLPRALNTKGQASGFLKSLSSVVRGGAGAIKSALAPINTSVASFTGALDQATQFAADLDRQVDSILRDADLLVRSPVVAADRFRDAFESLFKSPAFPKRNLDALLKVYGFKSDTPKPAPTTRNRAREAENYAALRGMVQQMTLASAARFAPRVRYESFEAAVATREQITVLLDEQIEMAGDDLLPALTDLRVALVAAVPEEGSNLPRLLTFTPSTTLPSLVIAHRIYGHLDRQLDIVARNTIRHPGFVLGGRSLQVLSDA